MSSSFTIVNLNLGNPLNEENGGTNQNSYAQGDIIYASATNTLSKLTIGTDKQVLSSNGTNISWASVNSLITSETLTLSGVSQPITPNFDYTFLTSAETSKWAARIAGNSVETGQSIATDSTGVYTTGDYFSNPLTIYNADGSPSSLTPLANSGSYDVYVVKYDTSGTALWSARIAGSSLDSSRDIKTDSTGVYVTGIFTSNPLTIYNSNGSPSTLSTLPNSGVGDAFIVKYDTLGTALWAARIAATGSEGLNGVTIDTTGVYVCGTFTSNPLTIYNADGNPSALPTLPNTTGVGNAFIVKYNISGVAQWGTRLSSLGTNTALSITTDNTGVYTTGTYGGGSLIAYNADGSPSGLPPLAVSGSSDSYIVKYNKSGTTLWYTRIADSFDETFGLIADSTGIYVSGRYSGSPVTFYNSDTSSAFTLPIANPAVADGFLAKYDSSGTALWASRMVTGIGDVYSYHLAIDSSGVYITGRYYNAALTFYNSDGNPSALSTLPNSGSSDIYIANYSTTGTAQWAARLGGPLEDFGVGVATDLTGVYITGRYGSNPLTIYNPDGTTTLTPLANSTSFDSYIVKYGPIDGLASLANRSTIGSKVISTLNSGTKDISVGNLVFNGASATTITIDSMGDTVNLVWNGVSWVVVANNGATIT